MKVNSFKSSDYLSMPWKNGQGSTLQLACSHTDLNDFDWRISVADVKHDGLFSFFENKLRMISILHGNGLQLKNLDSQQETFLSKNIIYKFSGNEPIQSTLLNGAIRDFNLIYKPERYHAEMTWHASPTTKLQVQNSKIFFIFNAGESALDIRLNQGFYTLEKYELLQIEQSQDFAVEIIATDLSNGLYCIQLS